MLIKNLFRCLVDVFFSFRAIVFMIKYKFFIYFDKTFNIN